MSKVTIGGKVADFELSATGGETIRLSALKGRTVVLYFYPKDNTPGCTREGQDFRDLHPRYTAAGAVVLGISRDTVQSHEKFRSQYDFPFALLSDGDEKLCRQFDVIRPKNMYGKTVEGVERSTFLIDSNGILRREWRKVKVDGHAEDVLEALKDLG
ncbi:MAG: peroxiredoxin [Chromatiales bacterium 21-64-14]|nr:MAG: peroxiredoxin [Chromatiales bacterium 21-64-14]HQU16921.1 peroxiredoxin [Gammaproteobacteria bacterium]